MLDMLRLKYDNIHMKLVFKEYKEYKYMHVLYLYSLNAIYLIVFYYVKYYLTPSGRLVDRLPIRMNGVHDMNH